MADPCVTADCGGTTFRWLDPRCIDCQQAVVPKFTRGERVTPDRLAAVSLDNSDGVFTPDTPLSPHYPDAKPDIHPPATESAPPRPGWLARARTWLLGDRHA